jgi:hypothetical protein
LYHAVAAEGETKLLRRFRRRLRVEKAGPQRRSIRLKKAV